MPNKSFIPATAWRPQCRTWEMKDNSIFKVISQMEQWTEMNKRKFNVKSCIPVVKIQIIPLCRRKSTFIPLCPHFLRLPLRRNSNPIGDISGCRVDHVTMVQRSRSLRIPHVPAPDQTPFGAVLSSNPAYRDTT